jgi:hypothetical protein
MRLYVAEYPILLEYVSHSVPKFGLLCSCSSVLTIFEFVCFKYFVTDTFQSFGDKRWQIFHFLETLRVPYFVTSILPYLCNIIPHCGTQSTI